MPERAAAIQEDALARAGRVPGAYLWGKAYVLDALCGLCAQHRPAELIAHVELQLILCPGVPVYAATLLPFPAGHGRLAAYFERLLLRDPVARTLEEARPYFDF